MYTQHGILIATASNDNSIKLWKSNNYSFEFRCIQTIFLSNQFCFAIKFFVISSSKQQVLLLFANGENLQLWAQFETNFYKVMDLIGHEDWIRCIDVIEHDKNIMVLTGSQDNYARVWKLTPTCKKAYTQKKEAIHMETKIATIKCNDKIEDFAVSLESVISGHEGWVYAAHFFCRNGNIGIMTCSIDKSIIVWYQGKDGVWMDIHRIGEMGGGNLGFIGAKISKNGNTIVAHSFQGSFYIWNVKQGFEGDVFERQITPSGHFEEVKDIAWAPDGNFLFSVSLDQTTRIHAPWKDTNKIKWNEIARIQIHGYDLTSLAVLSPHAVATGAEEKVIRILHTTENFINNLKQICSIDYVENGNSVLKLMKSKTDD